MTQTVIKVNYKKRRSRNIKNDNFEMSNEQRKELKSIFGPLGFDDDLDTIDYDDIDNIIYLNSENGEEVPFESLDLIEYKNENYVVLLPHDDSDDNTEVVILKVEISYDEEESYTSVEDEETLTAVFDLFKDHLKDAFDFTD